MKIKSKKILMRFVSTILAFTLAFSVCGTAFAASDMISEETQKKAIDIAYQIEEEGIVLLKNDDQVLPLKNKKVNVFGAASCSIAFAGAAGLKGGIPCDG